jgi:hypothetical protein
LIFKKDKSSGDPLMAESKKAKLEDGEQENGAEDAEENADAPEYDEKLLKDIEKLQEVQDELERVSDMALFSRFVVKNEMTHQIQILRIEDLFANVQDFPPFNAGRWDASASG